MRPLAGATVAALLAAVAALGPCTAVFAPAFAQPSRPESTAGPVLRRMLDSLRAGPPADSSRVATPLSLGGNEVEELPVAPAPPESVFALDVPHDTGRAIDLFWKLSPDDTAGARNVLRYEIFRSRLATGPFALVGSVSNGTATFRDGRGSRRLAGEPPQNGSPYFYGVCAVGERSSSSRVDAKPAAAHGPPLIVPGVAIGVALAALFVLVLRRHLRNNMRGKP